MNDTTKYLGFSGADIFNMVNTAAIRAAVDSKDFVSMAEFEYSHDKHTLGTDWKSRVRDKVRSNRSPKFYDKVFLFLIIFGDFSKF